MIMDYIESILGEGTRLPNTSRGLQYSFKCPFCQDYKERLFIHPDRKTFFCHNCESTGSLITFIADYAQISWHDALDVFRDYENYESPLPDDIQDEIYAKLMQLSPAEIKAKKYIHPLPEEFILLEDARGKVGQEAVRYIKSRGLSLKVAEANYIGYCAEGEYAKRIIMPDFEDGELIYWQARTWEPAPKKKIMKKFYRKVLNPSLTPEQIAQGLSPLDKSEVLGNIDFIKELGAAVICEGRMDSYTIGQSGAHLHGKHLSDTQFMKIVTNKDRIGAVYIMLDGDAFKNAVVTAGRLYKYLDEVWVCRMDEDKDPNSLGRKGVLDCINNAVKYNEMFPVRAKMLGWM